MFVSNVFTLIRSHPPDPAFEAGADVAAAPPSAAAAGASVVEAEVAKASALTKKEGRKT